MIFSRRYRVKKEGDSYLLQTFHIFRWIVIEKYNEKTKAELICNAMNMNKDKCQ